MPRIVEEKPYGGANERVERIGLGPLLTEFRNIVTGFILLVEERKDANGGAAVRKLIDSQFQKASGWKKVTSGDVDWTKCRAINGAKVCIGVEVQFSARSDLIIIDLIHLRRALTKGIIDVGILLVASDKLGRFLTDRAPRMAHAKRMIFEARVEDLPLIVVGIEHDGPGPFLQKVPKRRTKKSAGQI
jgi:Restriction endonuclease BglII